MPETLNVNWRSYAEVYDLMADNNPAYHDLIVQFKQAIAEWCIEPRSHLADLGAGTGNFSIELAQAFPTCQITHLDANSQMNCVADRKATARKVKNLRCVTTDIGAAPFQADSLAAITTVHALYAFPQPTEVIAKMFEWLQPGGYLFACDAGRMGQLSKWAMYLLREFYRRQGSGARCSSTIEHASSCSKTGSSRRPNGPACIGRTLTPSFARRSRPQALRFWRPAKSIVATAISWWRVNRHRQLVLELTRPEEVKP